MLPLAIPIAALAIGAGTAAYNVYAQERARSDQLKMNRQMIRMENTAVERRVEDMRRAGLSPTLAAGNAAGTPSLQAKNPKIQQAFDVIAMAKGMADINKVGTEIGKLKAETGLTEAIADRTRRLTGPMEQTATAEAVFAAQLQSGRVQLIRHQIKEVGANVALREANAALAEANVGRVAYQNALTAVETRRGSVNLSRAEVEVLAAEVALERQRMELSEYQRGVTAARTYGIQTEWPSGVYPQASQAGQSLGFMGMQTLRNVGNAYRSVWERLRSIANRR